MKKVIGNCELYLGDCLEIMPTLDAKVDMVLTDPPYGTTSCKWDSVIPIEKMWECLNFLVYEDSSIVMTASQPFTSVLICSNIKSFKHEWIWEKNRGSNFGAAKYQPLKEHESVLVFSKTGKKVRYYPIKEPRKGSGADRVKYEFNGSNTGKRDVYSRFVDNRKGHKEEELRYPSSIQKHNTQVGLHPTQKPVSLMEYLIKTYTNEGDTVLDFTMGSGTTGVACINTGRKFIGIEKDPKYFEISCNRIQEAYEEKS
jgi:site-specific DNA-methyltransferase (adenine-specific)